MKAYELIATPEKRNQRAAALDNNQGPVNPDAPTAVCWCAEGAIVRCYGYSAEARELMDRAVSIADSPLHKWNDDPTRTHAEVIALLKQIEL